MLLAPISLRRARRQVRVCPPVLLPLLPRRRSDKMDEPPPPVVEEQPKTFAIIRPDPAAGLGHVDVDLVPTVITDQEVGDFKEQDVRPPPLLHPRSGSTDPAPYDPSAVPPDRERGADHEEVFAGGDEGVQGRERVRSGVHVRVHQLHHLGGTFSGAF